MALLLATPSFAQSRGDYNRDSSDRGRQSGASNNNGYRENQRVTMDGKVSSFNRERDGYRVQLDRGNQSFWVPQSTFGNRSRSSRRRLHQPRRHFPRRHDLRRRRELAGPVQPRPEWL
jgi:hypothetical protein